jgi:hypothetical protein
MLKDDTMVREVAQHARVDLGTISAALWPAVVEDRYSACAAREPGARNGERGVALTIHGLGSRTRKRIEMDRFAGHADCRIMNLLHQATKIGAEELRSSAPY